MRGAESRCPISGEVLIAESGATTGDRISFHCPRCHKFELSNTVVAILPTEIAGDARKVAVLSFWIRSRQKNAQPVQISSGLLDQILQQDHLPKRSEQMNIVIKEIGQRANAFGDLFTISTPDLMGAIGAENEHYLVAILEKLKRSNILSWGPTGTGPRVTLTLDGQEAYERLTAEPIAAGTAQIDNSEERRDVFLCHASENKSDVVEPLLRAFKEPGISYWYDRGEILWGDSLSQHVNEGLRISSFVLVVLSVQFLAKPWPKRELYAALNIEASTGEVKVLPLLCGSREERAAILRQLPLLNDKSYLVWDGDTAPIVEALQARLS